MLLSSLPLVVVKRLPNSLFLLFSCSSLGRWESVDFEICSFLSRILTGVAIVHVSFKIQFPPYYDGQ
jgi:hypothetical protein